MANLRASPSRKQGPQAKKRRGHRGREEKPTDIGYVPANLTTTLATKTIRTELHEVACSLDEVRIAIRLGAQDMNHAIAECPRTVTQKQALEPAAIKAAAQCTHWCVRNSYLSLITQQCE